VLIKLSPVLRRLLTRSLAIVPAVTVIAALGDESTFQLLILSQVVLSLQLPFAIVPLIRFTNDIRLMGRFANRVLIRLTAWSIAGVIITLNILLVLQTVGEWIAKAGSGGIQVAVLTGTVAVGLLVLLCWVWLAPLKGRAGNHDLQRIPDH
jgi:manganese transport protein